MPAPHLWSSSTWWTLSIFFHQCSIKEILDFAYHLNSEQLGFKNFRAPCNLSWSTPLHHWAVTDSFVVKWENSQHFAKPPLVFPQIDDWGMSWEILYWWRFTNQIWAVLLIGQSKISLGSQPFGSTTQIWVVTCRQDRISMLISHTSFTRKQEVAWQNVGWFLRLTLLVTVAKWVTFPNHS